MDNVAIYVAVGGLILSIFVNAWQYKRGTKADAKGDASQLTTVIVKLETIGSDIKEIKNDLRDVQAEIRDHSERLIKAEQEIKVLNKTVFGGAGKGDK